MDIVLLHLPLCTVVFLLGQTEVLHVEIVLAGSLLAAFQFTRERTLSHSGMQFPVGDSFS